MTISMIVFLKKVDFHMREDFYFGRNFTCIRTESAESLQVRVVSAER